MADRRRFVVHMGGMAVLVTIGACAGGDDDDDAVSGTPTTPPPSPTPVTCAGTGAAPLSISGNHGHSVSIPPADMTAGTTQSYSIQGGSIHDHSITVTTAHFTSLNAGQTVTITSTSDGTHTHSVTLQCLT